MKKMWWQKGDAWNDFAHIYFDETVPWDTVDMMDDDWDDIGICEQMWAMREQLA